MTAMTEHAPPLNAPTPGELAIAAHGGTTLHAVSDICITVHGEVMAVCICSQIGYGATEDEARAELKGHETC